MEKIRQLEEKIGYRFNDIAILRNAVTHSSYIKEHDRREKSNERLEFLGDAFFDAIIGEELYRSFPEKEEGFLSRTRAALVCEKSLANEAQKLDIGRYLLLGNGEERNGGRHRESILADTMEAIFGAVYLDGGFEAALPLVMEHVIRPLAEQAMESDRKDYKTQLQELVQKRRMGAIQYELTGAEGPEHQRIFHMVVLIAGIPMGSGSGSSKQAAGQSAAQAALKILTETPQENTEEICD